MLALLSFVGPLLSATEIEAKYKDAAQSSEAGRWQETIDRCKEVITLSEKAKDDEKLYKCYGILGEAYDSLHKPSEAVDAYKEAFRIAKGAGAQTYAATYAHLAGQLYLGFDDPQEPFQYLQEALRLNQKRDAHLESWTRLRIGEAYQRQSNWKQARKYYEEAFQLHQLNKDKEGECYGYKNLGDLWLIVGEYDKAIPFYNQALGLVDDQKLVLANKQRLRYMILSNLSLAHQRKGEYEPAQKYAQQALDIGERYKNKPILQEMSGRIGTIYLRMEKLEDARRQLQRALGMAEETGQKQWEGLWLGRLGQVCLKMGRVKEAQQNCERAAKLGKDLGYGQIVREATVGLGAVWEAKEDYDTASKLYAEAIRMVEAETEGLALENELSGFFQDKMEPYERMVSLCLRRGLVEQAFDYAQRARTRALLRKLPEEEFIKVLKRINPAFADADDRHQREMRPIYDKLKAQLFERRRRRANKEREESLQGLNLQIANLENEKDRLERDWMGVANKVKAVTPEYQNLYRPERPSVQRIQQWLSEGEYAIVYHVQAEKTIAFAIGKHAFEVVELEEFAQDRKQELMQAIEAVGGYYRTDTDPKNPIRGDAIYPALYKAYQQIFQPLEKAFPPASRLVIIRDEALNYLPFETLVVEERGADSKYLMERYAISYAYSASLLDPERRGKKSGGPAVLYDYVGFGDPDFGMRPPTFVERVRGLIFGRPGASLEGQEIWSELPYTYKEVWGISRFFKRARVFTWKEATEAAFRREAPHALIVHLATHNRWDGENDWHSRIVLAQGEWVDQEGHDGYLHASEIAGMDMAARMVDISACESGKGRFWIGEGDLGMPRAFLYAGVPSVLMTLWPVNDRATAELQHRFYHHLMVEGLDKREALRRAKMDLIKAGWTHPNYWAPFELVGDTSEIRSQVQAKASSWISRRAVLFPIAAALGLALWRRSRK